MNDDTQPDIPVGHLSSEKLGGHAVPIRDIYDNEVPTEVWRPDWPKTWDAEPYETAEDMPATDEPLDEAGSGSHRRPSAIPRWALPAFGLGVLGVAWSFWMIGNSSAAERSRVHTVVETTEPSVSPGPTVTRTVRVPSVAVTRRPRPRATVTVRISVTTTRHIHVPGSPGPTVTRTVTKCPDWGCS